MDSVATRPAPVSVVIPARNRLPLLRYCLASLEYQDTAPSDLEVVVVDDGSEDGTAQWLSGYRPPYALQVVRRRAAFGRAAARNAGLRAAGGEIVVFADADVVAPPTLIGMHRRLHAQWRGEGTLCVSGHPWCWRSVRTWVFPGSGPGPRAIGGSQSQFPASRPPGPDGRPATPVGPALPLEALADWPRFERWAGGPLARRGQAVRLARTDAAPWLWFVTRVVSLGRRWAGDSGGFCEGFAGYGLEDWEFGYRLAKAGTRFVAHPAASVFHQEHPPADRTPTDLVRNYALFLGLHPEAEVGLMAWRPPWSQMDRYAEDCRAQQRLREVAPTVAAALGEAAVAYGRAWIAGQGRTGLPRTWPGWAAHWGPARVWAMQREQMAALPDPLARQGIALWQALSGQR